MTERLASTGGHRAVALGRAWLSIGLKSAGAGQAVQLVAYETLVNTLRWIRPGEWAESWGLVQLMPGMNIVALAVLTGSRLAGAWGAAASFVGLFIPSVAVTIVVTALYGQIRDINPIGGAVHGLAAAAVGGSCVLSWRLVRPIVGWPAHPYRTAWLVSLAVLPASGLLVILVHMPVYLVLIGAGTAMAAVAAFGPTPPQGHVSSPDVG